MNKLDLFNALITVALPVNSRGAHLAAMDEPLSETGLDSLDRLMLVIFISDLYGVVEEVARNMQATTAQELFDFMEANKTKELPATIEECVAACK